MKTKNLVHLCAYRALLVGTLWGSLVTFSMDFWGQSDDQCFYPLNWFVFGFQFSVSIYSS